MKKFLSVLVLVVCYVVVSVVETYAGMGVMWFLEEISKMSTAATIVIVIFGGTLMLGVVFVPIFWGATLTLLASEAVSPSPHGTKYVVFSIIVMILTVVSFVLTYMGGVINLAGIGILIYCIMVLVGSKSMIEENKQYES